MKPCIYFLYTLQIYFFVFKIIYFSSGSRLLLKCCLFFILFNRREEKKKNEKRVGKVKLRWKHRKAAARRSEEVLLWERMKNDECMLHRRFIT